MDEAPSKAKTNSEPGTTEWKKYQKRRRQYRQEKSLFKGEKLAILQQ